MQRWAIGRLLSPGDAEVEVAGRIVLFKLDSAIPRDFDLPSALELCHFFVPTSLRAAY